MPTSLIKWLPKNTSILETQQFSTKQYRSYKKIAVSVNWLIGVIAIAKEVWPCHYTVYFRLCNIHRILHVITSLHINLLIYVSYRYKPTFTYSVFFFFFFFYRDFTPSKPTGHKKGKGLLKGESKEKSRTGHTTTQPWHETLRRFTHHIVEMAVVLLSGLRAYAFHKPFSVKSW